MYTLYFQLDGLYLIPSNSSLIVSTDVYLAASTSKRSIGLPFTSSSPLNKCAKILAVVVLPTPLTPENKYACASLLFLRAF